MLLKDGQVRLLPSSDIVGTSSLERGLCSLLMPGSGERKKDVEEGN